MDVLPSPHTHTHTHTHNTHTHTHTQHTHSLKDTEKEFSDLQYELLEVQKELSWQRAHPPKSTIETDLFVPTMTGFVEATKAEFNALQALIVQMKLQYDETLQYFGEDPSDPGCPSTDEFFGIFSTFLVSFSVSC